MSWNFDVDECLDDNDSSVVEMNVILVFRGETALEPLTDEEKKEVEGVLKSAGLDINDNGSSDGEYLVDGDVNIDNLVPVLTAAGWKPHHVPDAESSILERLIHESKKITSGDCVSLLMKKFGGKPEDWKRKSKKTEQVTVRVFVNHETGECATVLEHDKKLTVECHKRKT